jgi:hypothetical protein
VELLPPLIASQAIVFPPSVVAAGEMQTLLAPLVVNAVAIYPPTVSDHSFARAPTGNGYPTTPENTQRAPRLSTGGRPAAAHSRRPATSNTRRP